MVRGMSDMPCICLCCGVFKMEVEALVRQGKLECDFVFLDSLLHMNPVLLGHEMHRVLTEGTNDRFVLLYGDCHPGMHEMQQENRTSKVAGINCCEILLGQQLYRTLQREQAFIFLPEWTLRWKSVFTHELGFKSPRVAQAFMKEYRKRIVYVDTGVLPVPEDVLQEISDFFDMPVEVMHITLDTLLEGVVGAMGSISGGDGFEP